eukprot:10237383-Ditylum_brightwellii.AAC.1
MAATPLDSSKRKLHRQDNIKYNSKILVTIKAAEEAVEQLRVVGKEIPINAHHNNKPLPTSLQPN